MEGKRERETRRTDSPSTPSRSLSPPHPPPLPVSPPSRPTDPVAHALDTQLDYVGHASHLLSLHGGALGLSLFLPPGHAHVFELQSEAVRGNHHFHNMQKQMGNGYELVEVAGTSVDVEAVWKGVKRRVEESL